MRRRHGGGLLVMGGEDPGGSMLFLRRGKGTTRHSLRLRQGKGKGKEDEGKGEKKKKKGMLVSNTQAHCSGAAALRLPGVTRAGWGGDKEEGWRTRSGNARACVCGRGL